ncbi:uncharacterized protein LOC113305428 [Papaver somniferum]|uniref:uncharacterized protein LOC113305428 n=1 Tax=Papaver somniferum TaxID=3469 RepID=UPI000E6F9453|nr:uncharacterized protein LOC113305428 [Papaver somniferum]
MHLNGIDAEDQAQLERSISDEEMLSALKTLGQDRAPGPDEFQENVEEVKDLRPISLTNSVYKDVSKVLAEILKPLLHKLISNHQSAFVKGRQILDSVLIANECLDSILKSNIWGIICKIDLEKAFNNVRWSFVAEFLVRIGFGAVWRKWSAGRTQRVPFSVLVNGSSCGKLTSQKCLHQGDTLLPFLFLLVSKFLITMFSKAAEVGWLDV